MGFLFTKKGEDGCEYVECKGCGKDIIKTSSLVCMDCFNKARTTPEEKDDYDELRSSLQKARGWRL